MKTRFIRINDVSEIDTAKASVYDLNNRYIDARGNMFGLRFNRDSKKIEIIKILRTPAKTAPYFQQKLFQQKRTHTKNDGAPDAEGIETHYESTIDADDMEAIPFNPESFINNALELMRTHRDRLTGIMMNIKNSKLVGDNERGDSALLNVLFRNIEIDGTKRIEKILENHKEIVNYPRSLSYYQSKLDTEGRAIFDALNDDSRRKKFIYLSEMYHSIKNLYNSLQRVLTELNTFLEEKNIDDVKNLTFLEKQNHQDAAISLANTMKEIAVLLRDISHLEEYVYTQDNF
jgi:hypothetical protein